MGSEPAAGGEVRGYAGGEQGNADDDGSCCPEQGDVTALEEEVQDAEDEDQHCGLCKEGRAAARGDGD